MHDQIPASGHGRLFRNRVRFLVPVLTLALLTALFLSLLLLPQKIAQANDHIIYVNQSAIGSPDGLTWTTAFTNVQDALAVAGTGSEIWVAAGTYRPATDTDRAATFAIPAGVALYGGFAGTEASRAERGWRANVTILSGDIGVEGDRSDNSYHVVTINGGGAVVTIDGFTIVGGNVPPGLSLDNQNGGGLLNDGGTLTLSNVIFHNNVAVSGGGMANINSSATLNNVLFSGNYASENGGGLYNELSGPALTQVTFNGNRAAANGGGIYNVAASNPTIANSILWGNRDSGSDVRAAQIYNQFHQEGISEPTVRYSLVEGDPAHTGEGNITGDPRFVTPVEPTTAPTTTGNLRLQADSPAIDQGSDADVPTDTTDMDGDGDLEESLPFDLDGNPRIVGHPTVGSPQVDMGAYETMSVDVRLFKAINAAALFPGEEVVYTLDYTNMGTDPAADVVITDQLPAELTNVTINHGGIDQTGEAPHTWSAGELPSRSGGRITIRGTLQEGLAAGTIITNGAAISTTSDDLNPRNNESEVWLTVLNAPPVTEDDTVTTPEDTPIEIAVLDNDHDPNGDGVTISEVQTPTHGTATIEGNQVRYTPDPDYSGSDRFTYRATDGSATSEPATVTIAVQPVNDPPAVEDQAFTLLETRPTGAVVGTITATDPEEDRLTYTISAGNEAGVFALDAESGELTVADASQLDSQVTPVYTLTVEVSDGELPASATITIDILTHRNYYFPVIYSCPGTIETEEPCRGYTPHRLAPPSSAAPGPARRE